MVRMLRRFRDDEGGAALAMVAVFSVALLATAAIAIDLAMLFTARGEAQRAADSAALAGASAFLDFSNAADAVAPAEIRAVEYATRNHVRNQFVDSANVEVQVIPAIRRVRVWVRQPQVPTWFARFIGITAVDVQGYAAAEAVESGATKCLKPWAVVDIWDEKDPDQDLDGDSIWDFNEDWVFDPDVDVYARADSVGDSREGVTGYGSAFRNGKEAGVEDDLGRQLKLKAQDPQDEWVPSPGVFLPWRIPEDGTTEDCSKFGGGGTVGAAAYRKNICSCNTNTVELGKDYPIEPGNMVGPTHQGVKQLIEDDPTAYWDPATKTVKNTVAGPDNWKASPRIVKIALMAPGQITGSGMQSVKFNNFAMFFIEEQKTLKDPVTGRFLFYVSGDDEPGTTTGALTLLLRLVE